MHVATLLTDAARLTGHLFVSGLWQGLALISAAALVLRLIPRLSATIRFVLWTLTFALVLLLPLFEFHSAAAATHAAAPIHIHSTWAVAIASLWLAFTLTRLVQLAVQTLGLRRIWRRATPIAPDPSAQAILNKARNAQLCTSPDVDSPSVIGFFRPRLLIPASLHSRLTSAELHHIVLHECEHLRRHDDWLNLAQKIALALFPLNPALLWVDRRLSLERELACDAGVVARIDAPFAYASSLTRLAEHRLTTRRLALALSAWTGRSELAQRVHTLIRPIRSLTPLQTRISAAAITISLAAGATTLSRAPELVAFTNPIAPASIADVTSPIAIAPRAIPVTYTDGPAAQPHATLLKAVMPATPQHTISTRPTLKPAAAKSAKKPQATQPELHSAIAPTRPAQNQPRMILTTANPNAKTRQRNTSTQQQVDGVYVTTEFTPAYAAVPFGDGWLIIQL